MGALPILPEPAARRLPDYLPARMVNEFVYCPRLFFYAWVEGVFRHSVDTVEGKAQHARVDAKATKLPTPEEAAEEEIHSRSVTLSCERLRVIAKLDLLEGSDGVVTPVDYKHGRPIETAGGLDLWPTDRVQLGVQALILRENGYRCEEGVGYYAKTKQRVRVAHAPDRGSHRPRLGGCGSRRHSTATRRLAEVPRLLPGRYLSAG